MARLNKEDTAAYNKAYKLANKEKIKADSKAYYWQNRDKELSRAKLKDKNKIRANSKKWALENPGQRAANEGKRRSNKYQATPRWLTEEQLLEIKEIYVMANELSWLSEGGLEVDHILPLQGKNVVGLHVPWNLQILPASLNRQKSNKV